MNFKKSLYIICIFCLVSGRSQTNTNSILNSELVEYNKTEKLFSGKLDDKEYHEMKLLIENELNVKIPKGKTILINYDQRAPYCLKRDAINWNTSENIEFIRKTSSRMCKKNNAVDFFVFSEDSFYKDLYLTIKQFRLDSGFFYNNVFTLHENCEAFFMLKPNGKFFKYYGEDYFSEVEKYLKE